MTYRITFVLEPGSAELLDADRRVLREALTTIDAAYLRSHPRTPSSASWAGTRSCGLPLLLRSPAGCVSREWQDVPTLLRGGRADCESVAAWRDAEDRGLGRSTRARSPTPTVWDLGNPRGQTPERITIALDAFGHPAEEAQSFEELRILCAALAVIDEAYLARHPEAPEIYASGARYEQQSPAVTGLCTTEEWQDVPSTLRSLRGDCKVLACWRIAELRARYGARVTPTFLWADRPDGTRLFHIQARLPPGFRTPYATFDVKSGAWIEDPSRVLGMR